MPDATPEPPPELQPETGEGAPAPAPPPVPRAFVCPACRKGRLDPAGKRLGQDMTCPACGRRTKVALEHLMGEERASRRERAKKPFDEMSDEEKAEFLAKKSGLERFYFFLRHRLGPRGMVVAYLVLVVLVVAILISPGLLSGRLYLKKIAWYWWLVALVAGAALGVAGHFGYVALRFYWKKRRAASEAADPSRRRSGRLRRPGSTRVRPPAGPDAPDGGEGSAPQ